MSGACASDPRYLVVPQAFEVGAPGTDIIDVAFQVALPARLENEAELLRREEEEARLGIEVPFVTLDDLDLSLEWSIRNLSDMPGTATLTANGANEFFAYVPAAFVVDPEEEEEPPPLLGGTPIAVEAQATETGFFREDQVFEAAIDLELITRGATNPFAALLTVNEDTESFDGGGGLVPQSAFAQMVRFDLLFTADRHMVVEVALRARDHRSPNRVHRSGYDALPEQLSVFAPADFTPPPPPAP